MLYNLDPEDLEHVERKKKVRFLYCTHVHCSQESFLLESIHFISTERKRKVVELPFYKLLRILSFSFSFIFLSFFI